MDMRALKCFVLTAELGSITRAASELGIVQSALSRKIQGIEDELGASFFVRLPRGIQLTPAGRMFLDRARRILREMEFARGDLKEGAKSVEGAVSLGVSPTLASLLVPDCMAAIGLDFPGIRLKVTEGFTPALLDHLLTGRIDLAVLTNPPHTAMLNLQPAVSEELVVVTPPGARGIRPYYTVDELFQEPMVLTSGLRTVIEDQLRRRGGQLNIAAEVDSVEAIRRMVMQGHATTLMPASTFRADILARRVDAFNVANAQLHRLLVIAQPLSGRATPAIRQVAAILARQFSELAEQGVFRLEQRGSTRRERRHAARG
jgi:LysR family transcriptional regulator, nitrogen assimilation regulatory protein